MRRWLITISVSAFLTFLIACSHKYVVLSSDYAYHLKSDEVVRMKIDTSLFVYDQFVGPKKEQQVDVKRKPVFIYQYRPKNDSTSRRAEALQCRPKN